MGAFSPALPAALRTAKEPWRSQLSLSLSLSLSQRRWCCHEGESTVVNLPSPSLSLALFLSPPPLSPSLPLSGGERR